MDLMNNIRSLMFLPAQTMPHHETSEPNTIDPLILLIVVVFGLLLIIFLTIITILLYKFIKTRANAQENTSNALLNITQEKRAVSSVKPISNRSTHWEILSLEEKAVIDILMQNEGNFLQKNLPSKTNFSKATVTRILSRLEEQDIIYRSPAGRGYRVFLKETESL